MTRNRVIPSMVLRPEQRLRISRTIGYVRFAESIRACSSPALTIITRHQRPVITPEIPQSFYNIRPAQATPVKIEGFIPPPVNSHINQYNLCISFLIKCFNFLSFNFFKNFAAGGRNLTSVIFNPPIQKYHHTLQPHLRRMQLSQHHLTSLPNCQVKSPNLAKSLVFIFISVIIKNIKLLAENTGLADLHTVLGRQSGELQRMVFSN